MAIDRPRERRNFGRRPAFKAVIAALDDGQRIDGALLDQSDGGAKIKVSDPAMLKGEFFLEVPDDDLIVRCRVAHVEDAATGLEYIKPPRRLSWLKR